MNLLQRAWATLSQRGLNGLWTAGTRHAAGLWDRAQDRAWDRRLGVQTSEWVEVEMLDVPPTAQAVAMRYEPTSVRAFQRMMRVVKPSRVDVFVDFGCGKGRVVLLAATAGFGEVRGVEFSSALAGQARAHAARYVSSHPGVAPVEILETDARTYAFRDDETVLFFYNPFDGSVLETVLQNLCSSLVRNPRRVWLIYHRPEFAGMMEEMTGVQGVKRFYTGHLETRIYRV